MRRVANIEVAGGKIAVKSSLTLRQCTNSLRGLANDLIEERPCQGLEKGWFHGSRRGNTPKPRIIRLTEGIGDAKSIVSQIRVSLF